MYSLSDLYHVLVPPSVVQDVLLSDRYTVISKRVKFTWLYTHPPGKKKEQFCLALMYTVH